MKRELKVPFSAPLNEKDKETETYGCRANNPNICANNGLIGICAFASDDGICRRPSRAWEKRYQILRGKTNEAT